MRHVLALLGLFATSAACDCFTQAVVGHDRSKTRTLSASGQIVDDAGAPIRGATVYLREWGFARKSVEPKRAATSDILAKCISDANGDFAFRNVALPIPYLDEISKENPQPWDIIVTAKGHGLAWSRLPPRSNVKPITITMPRDSTLRGQVSNTDGKPLMGARIQAIRFQGLDQAPQNPPTHVENLHLDESQVEISTESDALGRFHLPGLPSEMRIVLLVTHADSARRIIYSATTDRPQPPVTVGRSRSPTGVVTPREEPVHTGPLTLVLQPGHRLRVHAMFEDDGKPAVGARLRHTGGASRLDMNMVADSAGTFELDQLAPARHTFMISAPDGSDYLGVRQSVIIPADQREVEISVKLPRGNVIKGKVIDEDTKKGIPDVRVAYQSAASGSSTVFPNESRTRSDGQFQIVAPTGAGWLEIASVVPGYVMPDEGPTTRTDPDERFVHAINVVRGKPLPEVTFVLTRGLIANVRVLGPDAKPAAGARVLGEVADNEGKLTLKGLFPYRNHELTATLFERSLAARFTVSPRDEKQPVDVEVRLQPTGRVTGRVLDESAKPIPKATVQLLQHVPDAETKIVFYSTAGSIPITVERDGTFAIDALTPGMPYNVSVTAPGHASAFGTPFEGIAGETHRLADVVLPRADQTVAGTVVDPRGRPLAGVQVHGTPVRAGGIERSVRINSGQVFTDANGRFRLTGIPHGPVRLSAYVSPPGVNGERIVRTHCALMVEAGQQKARLILAGPDVQSPVEAIVGKPAPEFAVQEWTNVAQANVKQGFSREAFARRAVLLAFMDEAIPSTRLLSRLNELHQRWADKGLQIIRVYEAPVSQKELSDTSPITAAIVAPGLVPCGYSEAFQKYGVRSTPTIFLIDKSGTLRVIDPQVDALDAHLGELLSR